MQRLSLWLLLATCTAVSCKKKEAPLPSGVIGVWKFDFESDPLQFEGPEEYPAVSRTLTFRANGTFTLLHNDSLEKGIDLALPIYPVLLSVAVTDSGTWQIERQSSACVTQPSDFLEVSNGLPVEYNLTDRSGQDSLTVVGDPCQPAFSTTYLRQ